MFSKRIHLIFLLQSVYWKIQYCYFYNTLYMNTISNNQRKTLQEKLILYNKPFIDRDFLQKILDKFAPNYEVKTLTSRGLLAPIIKGKLYRNKLYREYISEFAILWKYMENKSYMIGWLFLYNQYGFSTQLANWTTVYNTDYIGKKEIAWARFIFRKVRESFFWGKVKKQSQGVIYFRMTPERALIQMLIDSKWIVEFRDDIYYQITSWKIDKQKVLNLTAKYVIPSQQSFITTFIACCHK